MPDESHFDFRATELDADLLATPFRVQTNWHVITGPPSCGKTTIINLLSDKGFRTTPEGARQYLEREVAKGQTLDEIRSDEIVLQRGIKEMQLEIEHGLQSDELIFLDRAIPDSLAWYRVFGLNPNEFLLECFHYRYASILMLDPLSVKLDGFRYKDDLLQSFTGDWHTRDYRALGYRIMRVPVLPPEERLAFILQVLSEQGFL